LNEIVGNPKSGVETDQNGSNEDRNDDVEPYASENEGDYGDDPEETDDESLIDGEAEEGEGFGAREEEEEPGSEEEEENDEGERVVEEGKEEYEEDNESVVGEVVG
jgi:hypothetical protein